ncbi:MAG: NACHT domain-containing protein, partial [Pseudonocardiaceae bacterium]
VILGGPGSGKTTLAVQLLLELLATRQPGEPIPVLVSLAGWDPTEQPRLHTWLAARLAEDYPSLRAVGPTTAQALAEQGHLLPILDGLDEIPEPRQPEVIAALNKSLTDTDQLVLTSRTNEYTTAVAEGRNVLTSAVAIAPEPLTTAQAAEYLTCCLPPDPGPSWRELLHRLRTGTAGHLAPVLATPLGLWLLRTVYITPRAT